MRNSFVFKVMMLIALVCVPFVLTSCEEEIVIEPNTYTMGILKHNGLEFGMIEDTYKEEFATLGISNSPFTMEGKESDCDNKIIAACKRAEEKLKNIALEGTYIWHVQRHSSKSSVEIYRFSNDEADIEAKNPTTVHFGYGTYETENMLEYCNIVMECTDGNNTKVDTITATFWQKTFATQLPCTYTFNKYYTLKDDKNMPSADPLKFYPKSSHILVYKILDAKGEILCYRKVNKKRDTMTSRGSLVENAVSKGSLNTIDTFEFGKNGSLK